MEADPFLQRVQITRTWKIQKATYWEAMLEERQVVVVKCGVGPARAAASVRNLQMAPAAIISVGSAGSLAHGLRVRHLIVGSETVDAKDSDNAVQSPAWLVSRVVEAIRLEGLSYHVGRLATSERVIFRHEDRKRLHETTGAYAVDMESHSMAVEAAEREIPFTSVRVVSDDPDSPPLPDPAKLKGLWRNPGQLPRNLVTVIRWAVFLRNFRKSVKLLPPVLERVILGWDDS